MADVEIEALAAVAAAVGDLDEEARGRVIRWAADRYGVAGIKSNGRRKDVPEDDDDDLDDGGTPPTFEHFAELFNAAAPTSKADRVLVAAYWQQRYVGTESFQALTLNKLLKDLGHGVDHISEVLDGCIADKPAQVLRLRKSGKTAQARKTYKLTDPGVKAVEAMLSGGV